MKTLVILALCLLSTVAALAQPNADADATALEPPRAFSWKDAVVLGLVEGATEYLPVSSTGHLILANRALGLDDDRPAIDKSGKPAELTVKQAADAYAVIIQAGAIAAVLFLYWPRIRAMAEGLLGLAGLGKRKNPAGARLAGNILLAFLPAAVLGLLLDDLIEEKLFHAGPVVFALAAGAGLMLAVERWRAKKNPQGDGPELHELSPRQCLLIGFMQCLAMWPGASRSMTTIVGGYMAGLSPRRAAEFSFLLGFVTLSAASAYKSLDSGLGAVALFGWGPIILGMAVSTVAAAASVKWLVGFLGRRGLAPFAWYRLALAFVVGAALLA